MNNKEEKLFNSKYLIAYYNEIKPKVLEIANKDLNKLVFKKNITIIDKYAIRQARLRRKIANKLPDFANNIELLLADDVHLEQSSSTLTANFKASLVAEGENFIDLTAGFGIDFYAIAHKYKSNYAVSLNKDLTLLLEYNAKVLGIEIKTIGKSAEDFLKDNNMQFDLVYIDPDRRIGGKRAILFNEVEPNIIGLQKQLLAIGKKVIIKISPLIDLSEIIRLMKNISQIRVVSVDNECKEILIILEREPKQLEVIADLCTAGKWEQIKIEPTEKTPDYAFATEEYLYEPDAALMKIGNFSALSVMYDLIKIAANTHLYTSKKLVENFPGRIFQVKKLEKYSTKALRAQIKNERANVIARNYFKSAEEITKDLRIKNGGEQYILAFKNQDSKGVIAICKRLK